MIKAIKISTSKEKEIVDVTDNVKRIVKESGVKEGICNIYVPHATAGITINENADPLVKEDIIKALDNLIPEGGWKHNRVDNNGAAHIKASIIGNSQTIPIKSNELMLGHWQNIFFCEFDGPRGDRIIIIAIIESKQ
ncbi:MAG: secondary thiamine-phosphate synthase enzyme YjbQ [Candidatus Woesearchaeota archaeon]|nr:secondary thiamine-phosphate synthase enzyme YjbQ [Candidatus Woesearchaeota archaeon]